jgi:hypothetical protein
LTETVLKDPKVEHNYTNHMNTSFMIEISQLLNNNGKMIELRPLLQLLLRRNEIPINDMLFTT